MARFGPARLCGVELGDTLETARRNLGDVPGTTIELQRGDLTRIDLGTFDLVYCIGVLHHLKDPSAGFDSVLRHTRSGGRFHCWVYAEEGNALVRRLVDPVRRASSRLPWWVTKYGLALPLVVPYFAYAKLIRFLWPGGAPSGVRRFLPLHDYSRWIGEREFAFFHHVAFDQLVSPTTAYIPRARVDTWLSDPRVEPGSSYVVFRNGNSWKFGGVKRVNARGTSPARARRPGASRGASGGPERHRCARAAVFERTTARRNPRASACPRRAGPARAPSTSR